MNHRSRLAFHTKSLLVSKKQKSIIVWFCVMCKKQTHLSIDKISAIIS